VLPLLNFGVVAKKMAYGKEGICIATPEQILRKFPGKTVQWAFWFRFNVFAGTAYWGGCVLLTTLF